MEPVGADMTGEERAGETAASSFLKAAKKHRH